MKRNLIEEQTRRMLNTIRLIKEENEANKSKGDFPITKKTKNFGDVRSSQEEAVVKTLGENVDFSEDALVYKPDTKDLVFTGKITALNIVFQFRYNDPSGDGCYVWVQELQLTDTNLKTIGKVRDAFLNWKTGLTQDGDLLEKLQQAAENNNL